MHLCWLCLRLWHSAHAAALVDVLLLVQTVDEELAQIRLGHDATAFHWFLVLHLEFTLSLSWKCKVEIIGVQITNTRSVDYLRCAGEGEPATQDPWRS